jgi:glycosyltransferase involved in cell wall biosynthesis
MIRALIVHAGNMYGGTERVLETLAEERQLCPNLETRFALAFEGRLAEALRAADAAVDMIGPVRVSRPDLVFRARARLAALIQRDAPDVIITQSVWSHAIFAPVVRRLRVPLVAWIHDLLSGQPWLEKLAGRWPPDLIVCNSRYTETAARTVYPEAPSEIVHGPLSFQSRVERPGQVRREHRTPEGTIVIAHVGRMVPLKGHRALIDALGRLRAVPRWNCWFVGAPQRPKEAEYDLALKRQVKALGVDDRVCFLGAREDVASILGDADLYCQPNEAPEAFGLSFVEALKAGLPVVTTLIGGSREIITDSCGRFVPRGDVDALAGALGALLTNPESRQALGQAGPARARALCDPASNLDRLSRALARIPVGAAA